MLCQLSYRFGDKLMQAQASIAGRSAGLCAGGNEPLWPVRLLEHRIIGLDGVGVPVLYCWGIRHRTKQLITYSSTTTECPDKLDEVFFLSLSTPPLETVYVMKTNTDTDYLSFGHITEWSPLQDYIAHSCFHHAKWIESRHFTCLSPAAGPVGYSFNCRNGLNGSSIRGHRHRGHCHQGLITLWSSKTIF